VILEALNEYVAPKVWKHDRTKTIGSSEVGGCIRRTWYTKHVTAHDADHAPSWGAAERGNLFEAHLWEPALRKKYGKNLLYAGKDQQTFIDGELSATPDGLLINAPRDILLKKHGIKNIGNCLSLECKTIDPRVNLGEAKHQNIMQVQVSMGVIRAKTSHKPTHALLSYANASFYDIVTEFVVEFDKKAYDVAKRRADMIYRAKVATDLKPEGYIKGGKECDHCPWVKACGIARHNLPSAKYTPVDIDLQLKAEFIDMVRQANLFKEQKELAEADYKEACEEIKDRLREKNLRKIEGVLSWSDVKGRTSYDMKALAAKCKAKGISVEDYLQEGEGSSRLTLLDV
jgi:hypothetical protein